MSFTRAPMEFLVLFFSGLASLGLLTYSAHGWLAFLRVLRAKGAKRAGPAGPPAALTVAPVLTTQIPICNDGPGVERVLRAAAAMTYPPGRHEIQVLDDSTDDTRVAVDRVARELRHAGHRIVVLRRVDRQGGRVGALAIGLRHAAGELVAVLDRQLTPPRDFLSHVVPLFIADARLGLILAAAKLVDGAEGETNPAAASCPRPFGAGMGTGVPGDGCRCAAVWRRDAIHAAGGWQGDTLAESLDLFYRARVRGWRTLNLTELDLRAEAPASVMEYTGLQARWAQGSIQVARKLLPVIWRRPFRLTVKLAATVHLSEAVVYPLMLIAALLAVPAAASVDVLPAALQPLAIGVLVAGLLAPHALYVATQRLMYPHWWRRIASFPALICLGVGVAVANSRAVFDGFTRRRCRDPHPQPRGGAKPPAARAESPLLAWIEVSVGAYCAVSLGLYLSTGRLVLGPLLFGYAVGFLVTGVSGLHELYEERTTRLRRLLAGRRGTAAGPPLRTIRAGRIA